MSAIKKADLCVVLSDFYDIFMGHISYENRCASSSEVFANIRIEKVIYFVHEEFTKLPQVTENIGIIENNYRDKIEIVHTSASDPIKTLKV